MGRTCPRPSRFAPPVPLPAPCGAGPPMSLFLFRLIGGRQFALTSDDTGRNIPAGFQNGGWEYVKRVRLLPDEVRVDFDPGTVAAAIARDGYALIGGLSVE